MNKRDLLASVLEFFERAESEARKEFHSAFAQGSRPDPGRELYLRRDLDAAQDLNKRVKEATEGRAIDESSSGKVSFGSVVGFKIQGESDARKGLYIGGSFGSAPIAIQELKLELLPNDFLGSRVGDEVVVQVSGWDREIEETRYCIESVE